MRMVDKVFDINPELATFENPDYEKFHKGLVWGGVGAVAIAGGVVGLELDIDYLKYSILGGGLFSALGFSTTCVVGHRLGNKNSS
jgi:hypothetical protein